MKRIGGFRRKSRQKLRKPLKSKGKQYVTYHLQSFEEGEKVLLKAEPNYHKGLFALKFHGKIGVVVGSQGECYKIRIRDGKKYKEVLSHPVHIRKV